MFIDLSELEHVFEKLDTESKLPTEERLGWICDLKSEFNKRLTALMRVVNKREQSAGLAAGQSYQSFVLGELYRYLIECSKPSKLKAHLPEFKDLLFKAMIISLDHRVDDLKLYAEGKDQAFKKLKPFDNNDPDKKRRGLDELSLLLKVILEELGEKASGSEVISKLEELAEDMEDREDRRKLIQEVDRDELIVYWGKDKKTSFVSIRNRLSKLRKLRKKCNSLFTVTGKS